MEDLAAIMGLDIIHTNPNTNPEFLRVVLFVVVGICLGELKISTIQHPMYQHLCISTYCLCIIIYLCISINSG